MMEVAPRIAFLCRLALAGFFFWSGWVKLQDLSAFTESVGNYQFSYLEAPVDAVIAYSLPWVEIFAAIAILLPWTKQAGLLSLVVMLFVFTVAIGVVWAQGLNINCGCYGKDGEPTNYPLKVTTNCLLIMLSLALMVDWRGKGVLRDTRLASA